MGNLHVFFSVNHITLIWSSELCIKINWTRWMLFLIFVFSVMSKKPAASFIYSFWALNWTPKKIHIIFITKQSIPFSFHLNIKVKFIHGLLLAERFVRIKDSSQYHDVASARLWPQFSDKRSPQSAEICLAPRRWWINPILQRTTIAQKKGGTKWSISLIKSRISPSCALVIFTVYLRVTNSWIILQLINCFRKLSFT